MSGEWKDWGHVHFTPGNPPTIGTASGAFPAAAASYTRTGAGDYSFTVPTDYAIDATECFTEFYLAEALAASELTSFSLVHTSDTVKQLLILREGAAGAVSALTDITGPVIIRMKKRTPQT